MEADDRPTPEENLDRTQPVPPPAEGAQEEQERTRDMTPAAPQESAAERDRRLAGELARRGVPPDEVQRLLALSREGAPVPTPATKKAASVVAAPPSIPPSEAYVPKPTITLPDFREATPQQRAEADRLLTSVNIARRRGNFKEAEKGCREALERAPQDAAALELYGDILQSTGRVDDALYAYQRATEADANRKTVEKKYAELMLRQNREIEMLREEYIPRNPNVAVFASALFPGAGQVYNGETLKGLVIAAVFLVCVYALGWTNYGFSGSHERISPSLVAFTAVATLTYVYALVDANMTARRGKRLKSGWEI